jgi:hypothetical protein
VTLAAVAALLFVVSPTLADSVAWLDRDTLVATLGTLASARLVLCQRRRCLAHVAAALCAAIAYCSKELAVIVLPAVTIMVMAAQQAEGGWRSRHCRAALRAAPILALAATYLGVRAAVIGHWVGGYPAAISTTEMLAQRGIHAATLLFPLPTRLTGVWFGWLAPGLVALLLLLGLRTCPRWARQGAWLAGAWILVVNLTHVSVRVDREDLQDARYLFPAVPALCMLLAAAATGPSALLRRSLLVAYAALCVVGQVSTARDWLAAGRASEALRAELTRALRASAAPLQVTGIPGTHRGAHLGISAESMGRQPFQPPELAGRTSFIVDIAAPHAGARRATALLALWRASLAPASTAVELLHWDRARAILQPALRDSGEVEVRGRVVTSAAARLACTELDLIDLPDRESTQAGVGMFAGVLQVHGDRRALAVRTATSVPASLHLSAQGLQVRVRIVGAPGSGYALLLGRARRPLVLGDLGVLLVETPELASTGLIGRDGVVEIDVAVPNAAVVRAQVGLFAESGALFLSECACLD